MGRCTCYTYFDARKSCTTNEGGTSGCPINHAGSAAALIGSPLRGSIFTAEQGFREVLRSAIEAMES